MKNFGIVFAAAAALAGTVGLVIPVEASQDNPQHVAKPDLSGLRDFDFLVGDWRVQHRRLKERLANSHEWQDFDGTCHRVGGNPCSTAGLGARMAAAGYLYLLNATTQVYLAGYRVINDVSSIHSPVPALNSTAPGSDITGVGMGIFYSFALKLTP